MRKNRSVLSTFGCAVAASALLITSACGSSSNTPASGTTTSSGKVNAKLAAMVPASIKKDGKVVVASDPSYAPMESVASDGNTIVGVDPEIGAAIGDILGVKFVFEKSTFDAIIPGLASGKYGLGMSSFTDTKVREKVVDFVTYFQAGTDLMVPAGNPKKLSTSDTSLCGTSVGAEKGTIQADDITARAKKCTGAGGKTIALKVYPDQSAVNLALSSGQIDAALADSGVAGYMASKSNNKFEVVGSPYATAPYGIAVPKNTGDFAKAIQGALAAMIADGSYAKILKKWASDGGAVTAPALNAAQS